MSKECLSLLKEMLALDPENRLTAQECLAHEFFDDVRDFQITELVKDKIKIRGKASSFIKGK